MPDLPSSPQDLVNLERHSVRQMLISAHRASASSQLRLPSEGGAFPSAYMVQPLPVVPDANWLRGDIRYACLHQGRTVLVNAANEQSLRIFCAQHVIEEVFEHSREWTERATPHVSHEDFMTRLRNEYLAVIRVVPNDGVPYTWMSPDERARIAALTDRDDVPSVILALAVRGFISLG